MRGGGKGAWQCTAFRRRHRRGRSDTLQPATLHLPPTALLRSRSPLTELPGNAFSALDSVSATMRSTCRGAPASNN